MQFGARQSHHGAEYLNRMDLWSKKENFPRVSFFKIYLGADLILISLRVEYLNNT